MTDYTKLTETLHFMGSQLNKSAAEAIEALQGENERLDHETADLAMLADQYKAERDALQAKLDELQRQEPIIDFTVLHQFASDQAISYNKLCTAVRMCLAAPKALEPTILKPFIPCVCHDETAKRYCKDKGKCSFFEAHGITKGTP